MEQLVKILLRDHEEYDAEELEFELVDDEIWGKMRVIISNYQPAPEIAVVQAAASVAAPEPIVVDLEAQPKLHPNISVRRPLMTHI